jgi:hypothetical protein
MDNIGTLILVGISFFFYFLPTIVGWSKQNSTAIFVLNLFLGWTVIGWVVALVWACTRDPQPTIIQNNVVPPKPEKENSVGLLDRLRAQGKITNDEYWEERKRLNI